MKDSYYDENSCLSMVSSDNEDCDDNNKRRRSRSPSANRTLTSTSSNDIQSDIYDDSRSESPDLFQQQEQHEHQKQQNKQKNKIKNHSTPLVAEQHKKLLPTVLHQQQHLSLFNSPTSASHQQMLTALQYVHSLMPEQSLIIQHQQQQRPSPQQKPLSLCAVCGDRASGKHYGVLSCDGCRGFFKRSIRGNMEYVCKESQKCIIDVSRRNQCQSCRLKKCLEVKMNRDAVQHQRPPRSHQIRRDSILSSSAGSSINSNSLSTKSTPQTSTQFYPSRFSPYSLQPSPLPPPLPPSSSFTGVSTTWNQQQQQQSSAVLNKFSPSFYSSFTKQIGTSSTIQNEFTVSTTSPNISTTSSGYSTAEDSVVHDDSSSKIKKEDDLEVSPKKIKTETKDLSLSIANLIKPTTPNQQQQGSIIWNHMMIAPTDNIYEMATRILFTSVKWTRTQRSFLTLPFSDQALLLEDAWSDLFILTAIETKFITNESLLFMSINETNLERKKTIQNFGDTLQRLSLARIDAMENYLLKSIIIYKSEVKELREKIKVDAIQEECLNALLNHTKTNYATTIRHARLLLLIGDLKKFSSKLIEDLFFKHFLGNNTIDNLLFDIFKSC